MLHEINNIRVTLQRIKSVSYGDSFLEKIFEPPSQGAKGARAFVAGNLTRGGYRVVPKKSRLTQLTSHVLTCFPHFHSGPRITRAPTPSIIKRVVRVPVLAPASIAR